MYTPNYYSHTQCAWIASCQHLINIGYFVEVSVCVQDMAVGPFRIKQELTERQTERVQTHTG